jgi:hypothetical protein
MIIQNSDAATVLHALRYQRDDMVRMNDAHTAAWEGDCPPCAWFDRNAFLGAFRLRLAGLNAAIARRL